MTGRTSWRGGPRRAALALSIVGVVLGSTAGCEDSVAPPPPAPGPSAAPIDHLADDELAEGSSTAFGFPFPEQLRVSSRRGNRVAAWGPVPFEQVANYVRSRVEAQQTTTGPGKTLFERVTIRSPRPLMKSEVTSIDEGTEEQVLRIDVSTTSRGWTQIIVSRHVRKKPLEGLTEDQRWERLGLTKDGRPVDPKKFE